MKRGKIIVVEGPSNSGKTTTCNNMTNYPDCIIIDECKLSEDKSIKLSETYEDEISNQLLFFRLETERMKKATILALEGKNVIMDRSSLSIVAVSYALEKLGDFKTFKHAIRTI